MAGARQTRFLVYNYMLQVKSKCNHEYKNIKIINKTCAAHLRLIQVIHICFLLHQKCRLTVSADWPHITYRLKQHLQIH